MSKMAELDAMGVTDLNSYVIGRDAAFEEVFHLLDQELINAANAKDIEWATFVTNLIRVIRLNHKPVKK
jgi:hypothetical protein